MQQRSVRDRIAEELQVGAGQVQAAIDLLDGGATVPFIARYRKEVTGTLDDGQLRQLEERMRYLRELDDRRAVILESIREQGKLTDLIESRLAEAETKARLEDIYLPFKSKRRTKAQIAREAGLEPLAESLLTNPDQEVEGAAAAFINQEKGIVDGQAALDGARAILIERFAEDADLIGSLRERVWESGRLTATVRDGREAAGEKFADYFDFSESLLTIPSHRALALFRGEKEEVLSLVVEMVRPEDVAPAIPHEYEIAVADAFGIAQRGRPADGWLVDTVRRAWRSKISLRLEVDMRLRVRERAETDAIIVFATNLRDLLLAAPAGPRATLGLDPGFRSGVKVAVVDATGKVLDTAVIYPHQPQGRWDEALAVLDRLVVKHGVELVAIGNGTASRETDKLAGELRKLRPERGLITVIVSEAGASVYSASAFAAQEFPDMDVTLRGAVSIARRLQDPLAELVKIDPKSIGVGQYQHDLADAALSRSLDAVVEDCVNLVGVDLNTASVPLLNRVSGIGLGLAESIVDHRETQGKFTSRAALKKVPRLGPKAFEQCAGFLRIHSGDDPLDASSVHPEAYPLVRRMGKAVGEDVRALVGNTSVLTTLRPSDFVDETFGLPTVTDVLRELDKPGRDPRPSFKTAVFADGVEKITDLTPGLILEGTVTNVAAFGAFVDVGVHQDGLVHVSALARRFVKDPREIVKPGDVVTVKVLEIDAARKRIALTLRLDDELPRPVVEGGGDPGSTGRGSTSRGRSRVENAGRGGNRDDSARRGKQGAGSRSGDPAPGGAMAEALRRAGFKSP